MTEAELKAPVRIKQGDGSIIEGELEFSGDESPMWMRISAPGVDEHIVEQRDLFECMKGIRTHLAEMNAILLCNGARRDVYPSGMSRDMSGGLVAYVLKPGRPTTRTDLVRIIDYASPETIATVEEQKEFFSSWADSIR